MPTIWIKLLCLAALLSPAGCGDSKIRDGGIFVEGRAYEWVEPPSNATSQVYVDVLPGLEAKLVPLPEVKVVLLHGGNYAQQLIDETTPWQDQGLSNQDGSFHVGGTTAPEKFHAAIRIRKDGFLPAETVFLHDKLSHKAVVIMIRGSQSQ